MSVIYSDLFAPLMWGTIVKLFFKGMLNVTKWDDQFKVYLTPSHKHSTTLAPVAVFKSGPIWFYRKDSFFFWDK